METGMSTCPNCGQSIPSNADYCYQCGQKQDSGILRLRGFLEDTLSTLWNYDSSLWRTLRYIFVPGKVTEEYLAGKRKMYLNPVRMFVFLALVYFVVTGPQSTTTEGGQDMTPILRENSYKTANANQVIENLGLVGKDSFPNDSIRQLYYSYVGAGIIDTLRSSDTSAWQMDSLSIDIDIWPFSALADVQIDYRDVYFMPPDSIVQKYDIQGNVNQYVLTQAIKLTNSFDSFGNYLISKITWLFFLLIPFQGLFMKMFYWKRTYIEHLIFLLHLHSLVFIVLLIFSLLQYVFPQSMSFSNLSGTYILLAFIGLAVYYYLATKRVYRNSRFINFLKMIPLFITYWIGVLLSMIIVLVISLLLF